MSDPALMARLSEIHATLMRGDAAGADQALAPLLTQHPARPEVAQLAAMAKRRLGDLAGAATLLDAAAAQQATPELLNMLGNVRGDLGDAAGADAAYARACVLSPLYPDPWINRGQLASKAGAHDAAVAYLNRACELAPQSALARSSLGNALRAAGRHDDAVRTLQEARRIDPARKSTLLHLGVAQAAGGDPRAAIASYDEAERSGLNAPELLVNRGAAWIELGDIEAARRDYDALVARHPANLAGHRTRARLYWEFGLEGDPFASFAAIAQGYPREAAIWESWLGALTDFRQFERAAEVAAQARRAAGDTPGIIFAQAAALSEIGRIGEAQAAFEAVRPVLGAQAGFHIGFARHLLRSRAPAEAAAESEALLALEPDNQLGWAYLGTAWRMLDDPREYWLHDYERHTARIEALPPGDARSAEQFAREAAEVLRRLHVTRVHPADQTLRNGTQTPGALFDRSEPAVREIKAAVEHAARQFIAGLPDDPAHPMLRRKTQAIGFAGSWSVRLTRQGYHINHVHPQGWISSAHYFALPAADPADDPHAGALQLGAPPDEMGLGLPPRRIIEPRVGSLILFPSSMWHGTLPFAGDSERLTVAFDVVPAA